jgi:signal transduction histidine kinase
MFSTLRGRLLLIVALALLPALILILSVSLHQRQIAREVAKKDLQERVHQIAHMQEKIILQAEQVLRLLAEIPAVQQGTPDAEEIFATLLKRHQEYANLGLADRQGRLLRSALPLEKTSTIADQYYFQEALQTKQLAIGNYQVNRLSHKASLGLGYPILAQDGQVAGVVVVVLDLEWLQDLISTFQSLPEESITVLDSDGTVLARAPEPGGFVGQRLANEAIIKTILTQEEGTTEALGLDGRKKLFAFTPLVSTLGMGYVYAGVPTQVLFAVANRDLIDNLLWLGLVTFLALAATWGLSSRLIMQRVTPLVQAAQRLAAGDLGARTGLRYGSGELDRLARNFDNMGDELQRRAHRLQFLNRILAAANQADTVDHLLQGFVKEIAAYSRCPAVGIRILKEDGSIPYEASLGFSQDFFTRENSLSVQRDRCMCVTVITGTADPGLPYFTPGGSLYLNSTRDFLATAPPEVRSQTRNVCHEYGYESVALVPLRVDGRILGLIHVADPRENQVPLWLVQDLEAAALRLAPALERLWALQNIRTLTHELIRLQERERLSLSRELHDSLAQDISALKIDLDTMPEDLPSGTRDAFGPRLSRLSRRLQGVLEGVRDLAYDLRPPLLDQFGLVRAIQSYCEDFTQRTGVPVDFLTAGIDDSRLDPDTSITLYRLVQEGLTNVRKHAQGTQATVRLVASHPHLILRIEDDGRGFEVAERQMAAVAERRLGLLGMAERVSLLGGKMEIASRPGRGTRLAIKLPAGSVEDVQGQNYSDRG